MSADVGVAAHEHAIAEYKTLVVTQLLSETTQPQTAFVAGYLRGYLAAQTDIIAKLKAKL